VVTLCDPVYIHPKATNHISGITEARIVTFLTQVGYIKCYQKDDISPAKWVRLWSCDRFSNFVVCRDAARRAGSFAVTADRLLVKLLLWRPYVIGQAIIFSSSGFFFLSCSSLWSPCVTGQTIIFLPCDFYFLSSSSFFLA